MPIRQCALLALLAGTAMSHNAQAQSTDPFPASFELSSLLPANGGDGSDGFVLNGITDGDRSGISVASAGDVNGDGVDDLIIGALGADPNAMNAAGESYVVFGGPGVGSAGSFDLASLNGANGFVLNGIDAGDFSGTSVSSAGDVNGDGFDDLVIGARLADPNGVNKAGESYIVFGAADLGTTGVGAGGSFDLAALNGPNGFVLRGTGIYDYSGGSVASAGDVNGDGIDDLVIGGYAASPNGISYAGACYVIFGATDLGDGGLGTGGSSDLTALTGPNGFVLNGIDSYDYCGLSVSSAGDVNGDGLADLIIGAPYADGPAGNPKSSSGESYVVFGAADLGTTGVGSGGSFNLSALNGPNGFVMYGIDVDDSSGYSVSSAGDVNGDGIDDLIIGADGANENTGGIGAAGESYIIFGATDLGVGGVGGVGTAGTFDLAALNGPNGFVLSGTEPQEHSGQTVSSAGDINNDGFGDFIIGATDAAPNGAGSGASYLVYGAADLGTTGVGTGGTFELAALDGTNGFALNGIAMEDSSGKGLSPAGDINDDGINDLIIGAGRTGAGESYVVFGRDLSSSCTPDLNGDGIVDQGDIQSFIALFLVQDLAVDFNADGIVDLGDIQGFIAAFLAGC